MLTRPAYGRGAKAKADAPRPTPSRRVDGKAVARLPILRGLAALGVLLALGHVGHAQAPAGQPGAAAAPPPAATLEGIRAAGHLECGTVQADDDWNGRDVHGNLSALEADICRAVAVAALGTTETLSIRAFPAEPEAYDALGHHAVPLVVGLSPSAEAAVQYDVGFGPAIFYDSQRVLVSKQSGITSLPGLRDRLICALDLTPPERTLRDVLTDRHIPYALMTHSEQGEMDAAIAVDKCVGTGMETRLAQSRANFHALVSDFVFLPDRLTINPMVPAFQRGDQKVGLLVTWTIAALLEAESLGITRANVATAATRGDMRAEQLLGRDFATAQALGLPHDWAAKVIAATGNYGEMFERDVAVPYRLDRGLNRLWSDGGLMVPMPMQ